MGALGLIAATCGACSSAKLWSTHGGHMLVTTAEYCAINQTPVGSKSVQGRVVARICYLCGAQPGCRESCFDSPQRARIRGSLSPMALPPTSPRPLVGFRDAHGAYVNETGSVELPR